MINVAGNTKSKKGIHKKINSLDRFLALHTYTQGYTRIGHHKKPDGTNKLGHRLYTHNLAIRNPSNKNSRSVSRTTQT